MKVFCCLFLILFLAIESFAYAGTNRNNLKYNFSNVKLDTTKRQKFIASLLEEYEQEGRWVLLGLINCNDSVSQEIVHPISLFNALKDGFTQLEKKQFVWLALENLYVHGEFDNCLEDRKVYIPKASFEIKGKKINIKRFNYLMKLSLEKILKTYFDKKGFLLKKYNNELNELIAVCYMHEVKIITSLNSQPKYEIFE